MFKLNFNRNKNYETYTKKLNNDKMGKIPNMNINQ